MMMNKQVRLNLEDEVREFVGDFNKFFEDLEAWTNNNTHIKTWKDHFLKEYPKIFNGSSENEVEMDVDILGGELPYEEYTGVCHELGSIFKKKFRKGYVNFSQKFWKGL